MRRRSATSSAARASDDSIARVIEAAIWRKEEGHRIGEAGFIKPAKSMSQIGG